MIDLKEYELVVAPVHSKMAVNVNEKGGATLNQEFKTNINSNIIELRINKKDGLSIVLMEKEYGFQISRSGVLKECNIKHILDEKGVFLPARYEIFWDDEVEAWVGKIINNKPPKNRRSTHASRKKIGLDLEKLV